MTLLTFAYRSNKSEKSVRFATDSSLLDIIDS
jgi:hypothetical protein